METAAAILTKIIVENNSSLQERIAKVGPQANPYDFGPIIVPIYQGILEQLRKAPQPPAR